MLQEKILNMKILTESKSSPPPLPSAQTQYVSRRVIELTAEQATRYTPQKHRAFVPYLLCSGKKVWEFR
jgi:hypothetical protein